MNKIIKIALSLVFIVLSIHNTYSFDIYAGDNQTEVWLDWHKIPWTDFLINSQVIDKWSSLHVERGSIYFNYLEGWSWKHANINLSKHWILNYSKTGVLSLDAWWMWIHSKDEFLSVNMKFLSVEILADSEVNLDQNELNSTIYVINWSAIVSLANWTKVELTTWNKFNLGYRDLDKENYDFYQNIDTFDTYFKISEWRIINFNRDNLYYEKERLLNEKYSVFLPKIDATIASLDLEKKKILNSQVVTFINNWNKKTEQLINILMYIEWLTSSDEKIINNGYELFKVNIDE